MIITQSGGDRKGSHEQLALVTEAESPSTEEMMQFLSENRRIR